MAFFEDNIHNLFYRNLFHRYLFDRNLMYGNSIIIRSNSLNNVFSNSFIFSHYPVRTNYVGIINFFHDNILDLLELAGSEEVKSTSLSQHVCMENKKVDEQCSICHNILNNCVELPCKHCFHKNCIIPWFKNQNTCPNCRVEFIETSNNTLKIKNDKSSL